MIKSDLITKLAGEMNISCRDAESIVATILDAMAATLSQGGNVEIRGFGSFKVRKYGSYLGRNPRSGEKVKIAPKKLPVFKAGKELREKVNL